MPWSPPARVQHQQLPQRLQPRAGINNAGHSEGTKLVSLVFTCHAVVAGGEREFVVTFTANTRRSRCSDERTRARGSACAAELSRRVAHCVADFLPIHRLA